MMTTIGFIALGVWLILMGLVQAFNIRFQNKDMVMGVLAIVAGAVVLLGQLSKP
jgi:hypothetical protein